MTRSLGIHVDSIHLYTVFLEKKDKKISIHSIQTVLFNSENVKRLYSFQGKGLTTTAIHSLTRHIEFPFISQKKIEQGLPFKIEALTLSNLQNLVYGYQLDIHKTKSEVSVFLSHKEDLIQRLNTCPFFSTLELVTAIPKALLNFANFQCPDLENAFLVDLGLNQWTVVHIEKGKVKQSYVIEGGIDRFFQSLWQDRETKIFKEELETVAKKLDVLKLAPSEDPSFFNHLNELRNHLHQVFLNFKQQSKETKNILFTGKIDAFENLCHYLLKETDLINYEPKLPIAKEYLQHAISIGSALEAFEKQPVQFLTGDFTPRYTWRKLGMWGASLLIASFFISGAISFLGFQKFQAEKKEMAQSL